MTNKLTDALKNSESLRIGYQANIVMAFKDCYQIALTKKLKINSETIHIIANAAANYFLDSLCDNLKDCEGDGEYMLIHTLEKYLEDELQIFKRPEC